MEVRRDMRFRAVGWLLYFSILFLFTTPLCAEELYTRTDELSCGNTVVQAFTTCTEDSHDLDTAMCTDQHFLFINKATGASVRLEGSGDPTVDGGNSYERRPDEHQFVGLGPRSHGCRYEHRGERRNVSVMSDKGRLSGSP